MFAEAERFAEMYYVKRMESGKDHASQETVRSLSQSSIHRLELFQALHGVRRKVEVSIANHRESVFLIDTSQDAERLSLGYSVPLLRFVRRKLDVSSEVVAISVLSPRNVCSMLVAIATDPGSAGAKPWAAFRS